MRRWRKWSVRETGRSGSAASCVTWHQYFGAADFYVNYFDSSGTLITHYGHSDANGFCDYQTWDIYYGRFPAASWFPPSSVARNVGRARCRRPEQPFPVPHRENGIRSRSLADRSRASGTLGSSGWSKRRRKVRAPAGSITRIRSRRTMQLRCD